MGPDGAHEKVSRFDAFPKCYLSFETPKHHKVIKHQRIQPAPIGWIGWAGDDGWCRCGAYRGWTRRLTQGWDSDNFDPHLAWLVPCKTWFSLRQSWWEEFFSVKAAWTCSSGVLFQYSEFRNFSANGKSFRIILLFLSLEFLNFNLTIFWGISHFEKLTALKSSWYDGNEVMIRWMSNSCYMESCRSLVVSHFKVSPDFKTFQGLSTTFGPFFDPFYSCFFQHFVAWTCPLRHPNIWSCCHYWRQRWLHGRERRQTVRHQTSDVGIDHEGPGGNSEVIKIMRFSSEKNATYQLNGVPLHTLSYGIIQSPESPNPPCLVAWMCVFRLRASFLRSGLLFCGAGAAPSGWNHSVWRNMNATTCNQGRRFGLSVNCMSWVRETVRDSTVGLGKVFAFV